MGSKLGFSILILTKGLFKKILFPGPLNIEKSPSPARAGAREQKTQDSLELQRKAELHEKGECRYFLL